MARTPASVDEKKLADLLGPAQFIWDEIIAVISSRFAPVDREWKPSKLSFGSTCLLKSKKRTLLYMIPESGAVIVAVVLGERAVALALASEIPESIKSLIKEARKYAEGRGIRFRVNSEAEAQSVAELVGIKITPK